MWSQLLLCALVGFAAASDYGWKSNTEYLYKVSGRTLTGLPDVAHQYAGIAMQANLIVRPQGDGKLMAKLSDAKYAQVHTQLPEGWNSEISESKLKFQQLPLCDKPFQVLLKNGVVRDLVVSKEVQNWEANLLKSIVSQIQLDTQGEHVIKSHVNQLPEEGSNNAVFKTMEDTITGKYETLYDITPLPEFVLQSQPWLVPMPQMKGDGEFIEIVKNKNFSRGEERVGYHYGLGSNEELDPSTNQMGDFFLRSSLSRAVISGNLKRYTLQSSVTTNKIILSPTLNSEEKGMVVSSLNLTLSHVQPAAGQFQELQQPQHLGNLVYTYGSPFSGDYQAKPGQQRQHNEEYDFSSEEQQQRPYRHRRSASSDEQEFDSIESEASWTQDEPKLNEAPESPLLPMLVGYKGKSIKSAPSVNIVQAVQKIVQQIGHELQRPEEIPKEHTLAKFGILVRLTRVMNEKEMQQAAQQIYNKEESGPNADAWRVYRDAVAECGTGPALMTIQDWIQNKKIRFEEAAEVIATMAQSVRQPTQEYMRTFYALATKEEVKSQEILNDTAILSYATLVRQVYVNKFYSNNQFPVQSFGSFLNGAKQFVAQEFIPYLKQKLHQSIEKADSRAAAVYIRALGNLGHPKILPAFEPYLEGEKQCSQFQRMQMVLALDHLAQVYPKICRSVLYKIYQNSGEKQEIRVAAVFQLMRTGPPASMLQRMAEYTNLDTNEQVNAAVKSTIESAAQLLGDQFAELAENARAAEHLLTKDTYGAHFSLNHLRSYVVEEMSLLYKQKLQTFGSEDSFFPKGIKYYLRAELGGAITELFNVQAIVSSIEELTNVFQQQTEYYQREQKQQRQNGQQAQQNQWSSEAIARLLNIQTEEREQLEGSLLFQLGGGAARFFSFNNRTIELLPSVLREIEDSLIEGKDFHYSKFWNRNDMAISFPTEMSLPFIYTLDAPTVLHIKGQLRATAEPKLCSSDKIHKPQTIKAQSEIRAVLSTKIQAKIGFVTPFDHQKYVSGYDKNMQVYIPLKSQLEIDVQNKQMQAQLQPIEPEKNVEILHYSSWPYTAQKDILKLVPLAGQENTHIIYRKDVPSTQLETVVGKETGIAFRVQYISEQQFLDLAWAREQLNRHDFISAIMSPFLDETIQYSEVNVEYAADKSSARKVQLRMGFESRYEREQSNESNAPNAEISQFEKLPRESQARQEQFVKMAVQGISNAYVHVVDAAVEFDGQNKVEYTATAAIASSPIDEKASALFFLNKQSANPQESKPYHVAISAKARVPNTNGLDFVYALKFDPTSTAQADIAFGEDFQSQTKVSLNAKLQKSEERKKYLQAHPRAQECRREMQEGNQQLPACANMTAEANLMDLFHFQLNWNQASPMVQNMTYKLYDGLRYLGYYNLEENIINPENGKSNQIQIFGRFSPEFESVNVTLQTEKLQAQLDQIRVNNMAKQLLVLHPVFPAYTRVMGHIMDYDTYRPICVIDKTAANTFDNKTYPIDLGNAWTVMFQYIPTFARYQNHQEKYQEQQQQYQSEQFAILVRDSKSGNSEKEVKLTIRAPETQGKLFEIDVKPVQGECSDSAPCAKVLVNQKEYKFEDPEQSLLPAGYIEIYVLPDGDVKIEVVGSFYIICDAERVKLTLLHDKFRGAIRGLCGTFTGEESNDFTTPQNCILRNPFEFASTWATEEIGRVQQYKARALKSPCYYQEQVYANVISDFDAGRHQQLYKQHERHQQHASSGSEGCTKHQTRYIIEEGDNSICFTIRPVPVCKSSCNANNYHKKSVPVHCVQKSNVAQLWKKQIEKGASPDFSHKSPNKTLKIDVPESCSKY